MAVGLLYRYGYFTQIITGQGEQVARYDAQDFTKIPAEPVIYAEGKWMTTKWLPWPYDHGEDLEGGSGPYPPLSA